MMAVAIIRERVVGVGAAGKGGGLGFAIVLFCGDVFETCVGEEPANRCRDYVGFCEPVGVVVVEMSIAF